jgi:hypothetical protein
MSSADELAKLDALRQSGTVMTNHCRRALAIGVIALALLVPLTNAAASPKLKPTSTVLTISTVQPSTWVFVDDWKVAVREGQGAAAPTARPVTFTLSSRGKVLATFTASVAHPDECTFTDSTSTASLLDTVHATPPDRCSGGDAGYVVLTYNEIENASTAVRARYPGAPGWASSCSGPVNPETVSPSKPGTSRSSTSPCMSTLANTVGTATVPTHHLSAKGGTFVWVVTVHNAKTCTWSSSPNVAGFDAVVGCESGKIGRSVTFGANKSTKVKDYMLSVHVRGKITKVDYLKVVEAGATPVNCKARLIVGSCYVTFNAPDYFGAISVSVGGISSNVVNPDPAISPTPVGDQIDEVFVGMSAGPTGMATPAGEVDSFALALTDGSQGTLSTLTFDPNVPDAMGTLKAVAPNSGFTDSIYFNVPIGSKWSSLNYDLNDTYVFAFYP